MATLGITLSSRGHIPFHPLVARSIKEIKGTIRRRNEDRLRLMSRRHERGEGRKLEDLSRRLSKKAPGRETKSLEVFIRRRNEDRLRLMSRRHEQGAQLIREKTTDGVYPLAVIEERLRRRSQRHAQARFGGGHGS